MDKNTEYLAIGGVAIAIVAIVAIKGKSTTVGATFSAPNPASVAAVTSAGASEIASINQLTLEKMRTAASTVVAIAQLQTALDSTRVGAGVSDYQAQQQTFQVGLQSDAANHSVDVGASVANHSADVGANVANYAVSVGANVANYGRQVDAYNTGILSEAQTSQQRIAADGAVRSAGIMAAYQEAVARITADAQLKAQAINADVTRYTAGIAKDISNNDTTQKRISKPNWFQTLVSGGAQAVAAYFSAQTGKPPVPTGG